MNLIDCRKASLYTLDKDYICDAQVTQITDESAMLTFSEPAADILRSEVLATFYDNTNGLISCYCKLSNYKEYLDMPRVWNSSALCVFGESISVIQRRKDFKVRVSILIRLDFTDSNGKYTNTPAVINDISAGGIFVTCPCSFPVGQQFQFPFMIESRELILSAEVLRTEEPRSAGGLPPYAKTAELYGYGCQFTNLPAHAESAIRNFVFQQEMRTRKL